MRVPPKKSNGQACGSRRIDGAMMDLERGAAFLGLTVKSARARIERGILPHRRLGGRVVFLRIELEQFVRALDGVDVRQALDNLQERAGGSPKNGASR